MSRRSPLQEDLDRSRGVIPMPLIDDVVGIIMQFGSEVSNSFIGTMLLLWQRADKGNKQLLQSVMSEFIHKYHLFKTYLELQDKHKLAAHYSREYLYKKINELDDVDRIIGIATFGSAKVRVGDPVFLSADSIRVEGTDE